MGREMGERFKKEGIYVYLWLIHVVVLQKQKNSVKQLSFNEKKNFFLKERNQRSICQHLLDHSKKQGNSRKISASLTKTFNCVDHNKLWKTLQEMGLLDHLTCLLRNLYTGQEAIARNEHRTTEWFQIRKQVRQGCVLSPYLFNLYAEYIVWNTGLNEAQAGIKISGRNTNNLRYADDTFLMAKKQRGTKRASKRWWKRRVKKLA